MDNNRLTAIRARLASISKSPWRQCGADRGGCECGQVWSATEDLPVATAHGGDYPDVPNPSPATAKANAALIAHAPEDLTYLCDEVERLTSLIGAVIQEAKHHHAGRGQSLEGPGALPVGLARALARLESETEGRP